MRKRDKTRTSTGNAARNIKAQRTGKERQKEPDGEKTYQSTGHARDDIKDPSGRGRQRWNRRQEDGRDGKTKSTRRLQSTGVLQMHGLTPHPVVFLDTFKLQIQARDHIRAVKSMCKLTHSVQSEQQQNPSGFTRDRRALGLK
ncbi:hypothetical protein E1301_Tti001155 [Triplophysa tibetana]|uniref:Uncharacterized protein n=1 Tax=Triplophysa tibetana TaxID=1572043 RepID=A0A5A9PAP0_9TELE|nr:hypothetical protein E1301_Tti001155 [Triplophysa tibetana]